jgi:Aminotransferase class-III
VARVHLPRFWAEEVAAIARADEVQAGRGRSGEHLWSFAQYGIPPDVVTLGKPMGNGYPVAALVTRPELSTASRETEVFSTFGGNPVATGAALAVLDVIEDERLIENAQWVGEELLEALRDRNIGEVRGRGLLVGVELASAELAEDVVNRMRDAGVLINRTGSSGHVLKIARRSSSQTACRVPRGHGRVSAPPFARIEATASSEVRSIGIGPRRLSSPSPMKGLRVQLPTAAYSSRIGGWRPRRRSGGARPSARALPRAPGSCRRRWACGRRACRPVTLGLSTRAAIEVNPRSSRS